MQPPIVVVYKGCEENFGSEVIDLHNNLKNAENRVKNTVFTLTQLFSVTCFHIFSNHIGHGANRNTYI